MAKGKKNDKSIPLGMPESGNNDFPVIGIGASAGGLEAFSKFFSTMLTDSGMAFVLIQHLDPTHTSNMVELLARQTSMPVREATDGMMLEPNKVYMIPPAVRRKRRHPKDIISYRRCRGK